MNILVDQRWAGNTGIGRVFKEVMSRIPSGVTTTKIESNISLGHPLSPLVLGNKINNVPEINHFYSPSFMPPFSSNVPFTITIHDLNHLYFYSYFHKFYLKYIISYLAKKAGAIITVSEYSKNEIVRKLGIPETKIHVVYNGVDNTFFNNSESFDPGYPYFLYVGNRREYKNIKLMIAAFAAAKISHEYKLILSGEPQVDLSKLIEDLGIKERVVYKGFISDDELPKLYRGAYALLFVSLMEGFGLPLLEAMASGVPVITSNITALAEIGSNYSLLVNPYDQIDVAKGIERLVFDREYYNELAYKGLLRSKEFSWDITGKKTWEIVLNQ